MFRGSISQPFHIRRGDGQPFAFAGLWESCCLPGEQSPRETCSLITTDANEMAREVHERMPVILSPENYDAWLDPANRPTSYFAATCKGKG